MLPTNLALKRFFASVEVDVLLCVSADIERLLTQFAFIFGRAFMGSYMGFGTIFRFVFVVTKVT